MWTFEKKTLWDSKPLEGPIPQRFINIAWILSSLALAATAFISTSNPTWQTILLGLSPIFGRLLALDLCYMLLLNIYIVPLLAIAGIASYLGLTITWQESLFGFSIALVSTLAFSLIADFITKRENIGGGDIKLIAISGAFIGVENLIYFLWLSCALAIILYPIIKSKNGHISFGPPLILSLWIHLLFPNLAENLLKLAI